MDYIVIPIPDLISNILQWFFKEPEGLATLLSPFFALYVQSIISNRKELKKQKLDVLLSLLVTRANPLTEEHVRALNTIQLLYNNNNIIMLSWARYIQHFSHINQQIDDLSNVKWMIHRDELFADLVGKVAKDVSYAVDMISIRTDIYTPIAHHKKDQLMADIMIGAAEMLSGKSSLRICPEEHNEKSSDQN